MSKKDKLQRLCNSQGIINALAIDQRGALKKIMGDNASSDDISIFKSWVAEILTEQTSSILLDPEYGWKAAEAKHQSAGLLMAYEKTGYDKTTPGRLPDLVDDCSVYRLKEQGADGIKILLYYDVDENKQINDQKQAFIERVGSECKAEEIPFFLEILTYDTNMEDMKSIDFARIKPKKVIGAMETFSLKEFKVDVLKVEVPVNMAFVEGFGKESVYTQEEASLYFKKQSESTNLPYIFLSAGVTAHMFQETLKFAHHSGAVFNGVLCGRATWSSGAEMYMNNSEETVKNWLKSEGRQNIEELNTVIEQCARPIRTLV